MGYGVLCRTAGRVVFYCGADVRGLCLVLWFFFLRRRSLASS